MKLCTCSLMLERPWRYFHKFIYLKGKQSLCTPEINSLRGLSSDGLNFATSLLLTFKRKFGVISDFCPLPISSVFSLLYTWAPLKGVNCIFLHPLLNLDSLSPNQIFYLFSFCQITLCLYFTSIPSFFITCELSLFM